LGTFVGKWMNGTFDLIAFTLVKQNKWKFLKYFKVIFRLHQYKYGFPKNIFEMIGKHSHNSKDFLICVTH